MARQGPPLIKRLWREAPVLTLGLAAALLLAGFFAVRLTLGAIYWSDPARQDVPIAGWMTPRFVAMSWDLPPEVIAETLELTRDGTGHRMTLEKMAKARGVPLESLIAGLEQAIAAHREAHP